APAAVETAPGPGVGRVRRADPAGTARSAFTGCHSDGTARPWICALSSSSSPLAMSTDPRRCRWAAQRLEPTPPPASAWRVLASAEGLWGGRPSTGSHSPVRQPRTRVAWLTRSLRPAPILLSLSVAVGLLALVLIATSLVDWRD